MLRILKKAYLLFPKILAPFVHPREILDSVVFFHHAQPATH